MLALTSPTSGGRLVGIVRLRTMAMEVFFLCLVFSFIFGCASGDSLNYSSNTPQLFLFLSQITHLAWCPHYITSGLTHRKHCSIVGHCHRNVFGEQLPSNGRILWLHYSDLHASCLSVLQYVNRKLGLYCIVFIIKLRDTITMDIEHVTIISY
jgi:hypothetical protein